MPTGTMRRSVNLTGTSLSLQKGQRVLLIEATNLPDVGYTRYFASPLDGNWADGLEHSEEDSILLDPDDVLPDDGYQRIRVPVTVTGKQVLACTGLVLCNAASNQLACALARLINKQPWHDNEVWLESNKP